jgi:iron complex outermembrane receptor protein
MGSAIAAAALGAALTGAGSTGTPAEAAIAPEERTGSAQLYRIPEASLSAALNTVTDRNGLRLSYDAQMTRGMRARLSGKYTVDGALQKLLKGTGLTYRLSPRGEAVSIILAQAATGTQSDASPVALPTIDVEGKNDGPGGRFTGYSTDLSKPAVSTKSKIPLLQNPVSVSVVPRELMDDQQAVSLQDALLGNVSGVQSVGNFYDQFIIRGFPVGALTYRNSLRMFNYFARIQTANIQSIEVLKGPASLLFGQIEPGGLINLVVKRPLAVPYLSLQEQAGSWGTTRTTVDATGPLTDDKTWLYRVNASYLHSDSFRDFVTNQDVFVAPTISYRPIEQFRLNIDGEYQNTIWVTDRSPIPAVGRRPAQVPISRYFGSPAVTKANPSREEREFIGYDWTFDITPNWSLTNRFGFANINFKDRFVSVSAVNDLTGIAQRNVFDGILPSRQTTAANLDLNGQFDTGPFNHKVLLGTDYLVFREYVGGYEGPSPVAGPINIYAPTYDFSGFVNPGNNYFYGGPTTQKGIYAQDFVSFADDTLHLLFGGRYDWLEQIGGQSFTSQEEARGPFDAATGTGRRIAFDKAFSPRLGAVVQPAPWLSFYGSFSQSFGASNALPAPGNPIFPPQKGIQYERGAKAELLDGRLIATLSFYDITKSNVVQLIPGTIFSRPVGLVESKGAELEVSGRIDQNWSLIGTYAYDNARITQDFTGQQGNRLANVPFNAGSIWVKYDADGNFRGLSLGGGIQSVGARLGDNRNSVVLPAYTIANAMVMYRLPTSIVPWMKALTLQLNVRNLFDTTYYLSAADRFSIVPGAPRTFLASIRAEF